MSDITEEQARTRADRLSAGRSLFQVGDGGSLPTSALQLFVHRIDTEDALRLNAAWHSRLPRMLPQKEWLEMKRFAIGPDAPKNTASRMLAVMTRTPRLIRAASTKLQDGNQREERAMKHTPLPWETKGGNIVRPREGGRLSHRQESHKPILGSWIKGSDMVCEST